MPPTASRHHLLTPLQDAALTALFNLRGAERFALFGGTALAEFYAGHRFSDDLDLFTAERDAVRPFAESARLALGEAIGAPGPLREGIGAEFYQQLFVDHPVDGSLKLDIGAASPALDPASKFGHIRVAAFIDLVAAKAGALADRALPRDGIDLWWIVTQGGVALHEVEDLLFATDPGLADYPQAWADALRRVARAPAPAWDAAGRMLRVKADIGDIRTFLEGAFEEVTARLGSSLA